MSKQEDWYREILAGGDPQAIARRAGTGAYCKNDIIHFARQYAERRGLPVPPALARKKPYMPRVGSTKATSTPEIKD